MRLADGLKPSLYVERHKRRPLAARLGTKSGTRSKNRRQSLAAQLVGSERVGFEPTVRLPVQRFSSSKIFLLDRAAQ